MTRSYDTIIIGSGQGGNPLAHALANAGRRVALIERDQVGGTCVNRGCTPTKTMVASARIAYLARRAADYGVHSGGAVGVDMGQIVQRKQAIVEEFRSSGQRRLENAENIDLIFGEARFSGPHTVVVGDAELRGEQIVINTGGRPRTLPVFADLPTLDSTTIMQIDTLPDHLLVIGGGYIGLEFAQMFRRFGSQVTVVQRGDRLLSREDPDVCSSIADILREDGIEILLDSEPVAAATAGDGVAVTIESGGAQRTIDASHVLVGAGRVPNSDSLNLAAAGVASDSRGHIKSDSSLRTNVDHIYAIGDVRGGPQFTHIAYDDFRILRANILDGESRTVDGRYVPYTLYTDPQLGRVGLTETQARAQGYDVRIAKMPMTHVARAIETDETRGLLKVVINAANDCILGVAALATEGGEIMSALQIAMIGQLPYQRLRDAIFAHPTYLEALNNLFANVT